MVTENLEERHNATKQSRYRNSRPCGESKARSRRACGYRFGSRARGDNGPVSDLDVCLVLQPEDYSNLKLSRKRLEYLKFFGIPGLDIHVYQQLPLYIRKRILKEGEILFCRDEEVLYEMAFHTAQEFEDFRRIYHSYLQEVARG